MTFRSVTWAALLLGLAGMAPAFVYAASGDDPVEATRAHKFHVTYGRMAVEGPQAMLQIRLFKDDLEAALQHRFDEPAFAMGADPHADSLFTQYFNEVFILKQGATQVKGTIMSSGEETMGREAMWWYMIRFEAAADLRAFTVRHVVLFDQFDDQKNIFKVRHFPSEKEYAYYFTEGAEDYTVSF